MINMATITENNLDIHMRMCQGKNTIQTNKEQKIAVIYGWMKKALNFQKGHCSDSKGKITQLGTFLLMIFWTSECDFWAPDC